jgi:hypothetical protein
MRRERTEMPKLNDKQILKIIESTMLMHGWLTTVWDSLTPKQRARAEMLVERKDNAICEREKQYERPQLKRTRTRRPTY